MSKQHPSNTRLFAVPQWAGAETPALCEGPGLIVQRLISGSKAGQPAIEWLRIPTISHESEGSYRQVLEVDQRLASLVASAIANDERALVIGGDHTVAIGTAAGVRRAVPGRIGLIWIDAHPDLHTDRTSLSGRIHGMSLAAIMGQGNPLLVDLPPAGVKIPASETMLIGVRDIEPGEQRFLAAHPECTTIGVQALRANGVASIVDACVERWHDAEGIYLSFDLDVVDPSHAPGVTTPVPAGLTRAEALTLVRALVQRLPVLAADIVEFYPRHDRNDRTLNLAIELIQTILSPGPSRSAGQPRAADSLVDDDSDSGPHKASDYQAI